MAGRNLKSKQKNGANSKFIKIIMNIYIHYYIANCMAQNSPLRDLIEVVRESFDLRYINSTTKFGEKNPTKNLISFFSRLFPKECFKNYFQLI